MWKSVVFIFKNSILEITWSNILLNCNGILLPKLFWPTVKKNVLVIKKNIWNSRLRARIWKKIVTCSWRFLLSNKLEKNIGILEQAGKVGKIYSPLNNSFLFIPDYSRWTRGGQQDPQTSCQANARLQDQIPPAFSCTEVQGITFQGQQTKHILSVIICFLLASKITKIKTPLWW